MSKKRQQRYDYGQRIVALASAGLLGLLLLGGIGFAVWYVLVHRVTIEVLAALVLIEGLLIPTGVWAGARWGSEAGRAFLTGLQSGVSEVMNAANKTADLKMHVHRTVHQPGPVQQAPELPPLPPVQRLTAWNDDEVIDV